MYTSQTRALAVLEFSANVNTERILRYLNMVEIEIPDDIQEVAIADLSGDWREVPAPASTKDFGSSLLTGASNAVRKMPSAVIPQEFNFLINPQHQLSANCRIIEVTDFIFDIRIKTAK